MTTLSFLRLTPTPNPQYVLLCTNFLLSAAITPKSQKEEMETRNHFLIYGKKKVVAKEDDSF